MNWQTIIDPAICGRLCLTLLHTLWQVAILALAARGIEWLWSRRSPEKNYAVYVAALVAALVAMPITFALVDSDQTAATSKVDESAEVPVTQAGNAPILDATVAEMVQPVANGGVLPTTSQATQRGSSSRVTKANPIDWIDVAPWIMALYVLGVVAMLVRLTAGIMGAHRMAAQAKIIHDGPFVDLLQTLVLHWSMRVVPALACAEQIIVPKVVGIVRPTILLPASAITGLSIQELEMVLAHELAHVKRCDMWANLMQRLAEAVLFFNPALWYLSCRISAVREFCCDELTCGAMAQTHANPRAQYAWALLRVVELSRREPTMGNLVALSASGRSPSELRRRVARLFGEPLREPLRVSRGGALTIATVVVFAVFGPLAWKSAAESAADQSAEAIKQGDQTTANVTTKMKLRVVYGDTGEPAAKVGVGGMVNKARFWETTNEDGMIEILLPEGQYKIGMFPRYRTPYLRSEGEVVVSAETAKDTTTLKLRPAAVVDITVVDDETGEPLSGVDVWLEEGKPGREHRSVYGYRSWEVETRISHYDPPPSDENGKMRVFFEPGAHRIGIGMKAYPQGYEPVEPNGKEIECQRGDTVSIEFRMRRKRGADQEPRNGLNQFELAVVGPDGKPLPQAEVRIRVRPRLTAEKIIRGTFIKDSDVSTVTARADAEGRLIVQLPPNPKFFEVYVEHAGYGPYWSKWDSSEHPDPVPQKHVAELDAGWTVGGIVVDADGKPIEGAEAHPSFAFKTRPGDSSELYTGESFTTAADGSWSYPSVPATMKDVNVSFHHADFMPTAQKLTRSRYEVPTAKRPSERIELKPGITVEGTVTDEAGQPIAGALVRTRFSNDDRETKTGDDGKYRLIGCPPRMMRIVVSAKGRAMELKAVQVDPDMGPVDFSLKPGGHIRIRVVDADDKPIPKARIFFQRWRGHVDYFEFNHINGYADKDGVWEWNEAPLDEIRADICRPDGMQLDSQPFTSRAEEYVFRPPPALVISGKVLDAETKQPIQNFRVVPGLKWDASQSHWSDSESYQGTGGDYKIRRNRGVFAHLVRIEADGYQAGVSRNIKSDEGKVTIDFELKPAANIAATLVTSDGAPAVGAKIAIGIPGSQIRLHNGDIGESQTYATRMVSDDDGRFSFPRPDTAFQLVITHASGFAYLKSMEVPIPERIRLTPWASVEGTFRVGSRSMADVSLEIDTNAIQSHGEGVPNIFTQHETTTGPDGRFVFERVFPGDGRLGRMMVFMVDDGATEVTSSKKVPVQLVAGETKRIELGGDGRPVVGKLVPPANFNQKVLWNFATLNARVDLPTLPAVPVPAAVQNDRKRYQAWWQEWQLTDDGRTWKGMNDANERLRAASPFFRASIDREGSFRIDDMPPGNYTLSAGFYHQHPGIGKLTDYKFSVPEGGEANDDEPFDLGMLQLEP